MGTNSFSVKVVDSPEQAPHYRRDTCDVRTLSLETCIVVKQGTVEGRPTVDLQLKDADGNEFVCMVTGRLLIMVANIIKVAEEGR